MKALLPVALLLVAASDVAAQQPVCMPREHMVQKLAEYGEAPVASGLMGNGNLLEILTSPSGSWSIIVTRPGGASCLLVSGQGWIESPPAVPGRDS